MSVREDRLIVLHHSGDITAWNILGKNTADHTRTTLCCRLINGAIDEKLTTVLEQGF